MLGQHAEWTGNLSVFEELQNNVERVLEWMDRYGDANRDGYVEYESKSEKGLANQGWTSTKAEGEFGGGWSSLSQRSKLLGKTGNTQRRVMGEATGGLGPGPGRKFVTRDRATDAGDRHLWQIPAARDLSLLILAGVVLWLLYNLRGIFIPLFLGLVFALVFNPLITLMEEKWRWPRPLTITLLLVAVVLVFAGLFAWLGPLLLGQMAELARNLPDYLRRVAARFNIDSGDLLGQLEQSIRQFQTEPRQILSQVFTTTGHALGFVTTVFSAATYFTLAMALVFFYFFVFAWRFNSGLENLKRYIPASRRARTLQIFSRMDDAVGQFFRGRLVIAIMMGIMLSVGWLLTGVPYWFFLGMVTGLLSIVPYLSVVSWPVAVFLKYVESMSGANQNLDLLSIFLWPSLVYVAVQLLEGWVLTPWIQSGQTNLNAATVLVVVIIGGAAAGVLGMLFAIPVAACIKILLEELVLPPSRHWAMRH
ncbi:MAG: AI-2E family transporter [Candidatus Binatia bacterium]